MKSRMSNLICASVGLIVLVLMFTAHSDAKINPDTAVGVWLLLWASGYLTTGQAILPKIPLLGVIIVT